MKQYHKNPRQITHRQYGDLEKWLAQFGDLSGITHNLSSDETITGNQRCRVIDINECEIVIEHKLDEPDEQGTVGLGYVIWQGNRYNYRQVVWDERTAEAANIIANRAGGSWDFDVLADQWHLPDLLEWGFEESDLQLDWGDDATPDPGAQVDKAAELQEKWQVQRGQIWQVGRHRVMCGDSTCAEDVGRLMGGKRAVLGIHDPPYGIKRDKGFGGFGGFGPPIARRQYDDSWDSERLTSESLSLMISQSENAIVWGGNFYTDSLPQSNHWIVWDKQNTMPTFGDCELAWTNVSRDSVKKYTVVYNGLIGKEKDRFHPTQKPVELIAAVVKDYAKEDETAVDLVCGSGTTLVACEQTGRSCRMMELDPGYCDVIVKRYCEMKEIKPEQVFKKGFCK